MPPRRRLMRLARALLNGPEPDDIMVTDFVRIGYSGPVGMVQSISDDHAVVAWDGDHRDIVPLKALRRAPHRGAKYDSRRVE
jgi:hypothetical protein